MRLGRGSDVSSESGADSLQKLRESGFQYANGKDLLVPTRSMREPSSAFVSALLCFFVPALCLEVSLGTGNDTPP